LNNPKIQTNQDVYIHPSAFVEDNVKLASGVKIWHFCHVRKGAKIGEGVTLGKGVFIDAEVEIGKYSKVQNGISIYSGVHVGDFCFLGPHAIFTNDPTPRSYVKTWDKVSTYIKTGASMGAGSIIRCGVTLGEFSLVGAGSVVTRDILPFHLYYGLPAVLKKRICACGKTQFSLITPKSKLIQKCCEENLMKEMYQAAQKVLKTLSFSKLSKS